MSANAVDVLAISRAAAYSAADLLSPEICVSAAIGV